MVIIESENIPKLQEYFDNIVLSVDKYKETILNEVGEYIESRIRENFEKEQTPEGNPWVALSSKYKAKKEKNKYTAVSGILRLTNRLMRSVNSRVEDSSVIVSAGQGIKYAAVHQFGGKNIPARPYMGLTENDVTNITDTVNGWLNKITGDIQ